VVPVEPEDRAAQQKRLHLVAPVIEDVTLPIGMEAFFRVGVLIEARPVVVDEPVLVAGEVRGHPVEYHAYIVLVQIVN